MVGSAAKLSVRRDVGRRLGSYNDRNDGFLRSYYSRSKSNCSRNRKAGKVERVKAPWKATAAAAA